MHDRTGHQIEPRGAERLQRNASNYSGDFRRRACELPGGYVDANFGDRSWGLTVQLSEDGKRIWLYGEELSGTDIVRFNLYRLPGPGSILKPCEMSSAKVIEFVLGFEPSTVHCVSTIVARLTAAGREVIAAVDALDETVIQFDGAWRRSDFT